MSIPLTPEQEKQIISDATKALADRLFDAHRDALDFITPAQLAGFLDVSPKTLTSLDIPRHVIVSGKIIRYRLSEVEAWAEDNKEQP